MNDIRGTMRRGMGVLAAAGMAVLLGAGSALAADGDHPDFTGMWLGASGIGQSTTARKSTNWPKPAPLTEAGKKAYAAYDAKKDDPPEDCMPWGLPRNEVFTFYPMLLTRTSNMLLMTLEYEPVPRRIYLDGRDYPTDIPPQWYGYSVGHWEGDTLVVETRNIREENIITTDGLPQSDQMTVVERYRLLDGGNTLEVKTTATDPVYYTEPMTVTVYWERADDVEQHEFVCAEGLIENITTPTSEQDKELGD
jgi:hypothetical protein